MRRSSALYVGLVVGLLLGSMYFLLAEPGEVQESPTGAVIQEPSPSPKGVSQECVSADGQTYCSISKRPCSSDNNCALILLS